MSFVFAEKRIDSCMNSERIDIHCDTKIGFVDSTQSHFSNEQLQMVKKYGIIKSKIICPELCISFAGNNIIKASELFSLLKEKGQFSCEEAVEYAYNIHKNTTNSDDIEFIISYVNDDGMHISYIKDGALCHDCNSAWIGSYDAFEEFQRYRLSGVDKSELDNKNSDMAFWSVVNGGDDDTVGGFHVTVSCDSSRKSFRFVERTVITSSKEQIIRPSETIHFFERASEGGYSYSIIPADIDAVVIEVNQMKKKILYTSRVKRAGRDAENKHLEGFMLPFYCDYNDEGQLIVFG